MKKENLNIAFLASKYAVPEEQLRDLLFSHGIIAKRRLKHIPKYELKRSKDLIIKYSERNEGKELTPERPNIAFSSNEPASQTLENKTDNLKTEKGRKKTKKNKSEWYTVGRVEEEIIYLTPADIKEIHNILVEDFSKSKDPIDPPGVKDENLLESAVFRPKTSLGSENKYPTIAMAAAALLHAIIHNHPFHNGNKRTALVSLIVFLDKNGWILSMDQDTIYDFLITLAAHNLASTKTKESVTGADAEMLFVAQWLRNSIRTAKKGEYPLQFRLLREILTEYGCQFKQSGSGGLTMKISCESLQTTIQYGGDGREIPAKTIHKIRRDLQLDEEHGCDSDIFYNKGPKIPEFIVKYRGLLDRLAKV